MKTSKAIKRTAKAVPATEPKLSRPTPVERAWQKFIDEFETFQKMPSNERTEEEHRAWEAQLRATDRAAYNVIDQRATCLRDMEIKIQVWAFTAAVNTGGAPSLEWEPHPYEPNSTMIASLRDDVQAIKGLVRAAMTTVGSIETSSGLANSPGVQS